MDVCSEAAAGVGHGGVVPCMLYSDMFAYVHHVSLCVVLFCLFVFLRASCRQRCVYIAHACDIMLCESLVVGQN